MAVILATRAENLSIVQQLIQAGAKVDTCSIHGLPALHFAASNGNSVL